MNISADRGFFPVPALMLLLFPLRFLVGVLLAALIHELGHLLALKIAGGRVLSIRLRSFGARIEAAPMSPGRTALCALAGPAAGALTIFAYKTFPELALAGLVQTIFNLIPVYPLDGGRALRNICCKIRDFRIQ